MLRLFTEMAQQLGTDVAITQAMGKSICMYIFALKKDFFLIHVGIFSP